MTFANDPKLENYLSSMERVLKPFPVSDRAEIVTEIKSHVLSTLERNPESKMDSVLAALGAPETVANRYLMERGLKPTKPPISPIVKWVVIGFLGTFAMLLITVALLFTKVTPLLKVDEKNDRVTLLGGLIDIDGKNGKLMVGGQLRSFGGDLMIRSKKSAGGSIAMTSTQTLTLKFGNGKVDLTTAEADDLNWSCSTQDAEKPLPSPKNSLKEISFDFSSVAGVNCELSIPKGIKTQIGGDNGKIEIDEPDFDLNVVLANGKVSLHPSSTREYKYALSVVNGSTDTFTSSKSKTARVISVQLGNGKITREN